MPGDEVSVAAALPERYYRAMEGVSDWQVYTLVFAGVEVGVWGWGCTVIDEHAAAAKGGMGMGGAGERAIVIPGGARVSFAAVPFSSGLEYPWPGRAAYEAEHGFERANVAQGEWQEGEKRENAGKPGYCCKPPPVVEASDRV